jgi:4-alpha-glucanotransferase
MDLGRRSGLFLHLTSLPGPEGIGTLGAGARAFLEFAERAGASVWQVCPLGPTAGIHGHSPYSPLSAFAGNPLLVDLDRLVDAGWLEGSEVEPRAGVGPHRVDFDAVIEYKTARLRTAFEGFEARASAEERGAFESFREREGHWLEEYALFVALKRRFDDAGWTDWPEGLRRRDPDALEEWRGELADEIAFREFLQFCFDRQWAALRADAAERGIDIVGDVPLYVGMDSADVWANRDVFAVGPDGPEAVAGVPPEGGEGGQRWGNPLYDWDHLESTGFGWWIRRFERTYDLVDVVRLDHFKGFDSYWAIPEGADSPAEGEWREAPGATLFETVREHRGEFPAIAEDVGHLSESVHGLRRRFDLPGMRIPQYADWCAEDHFYQPHTYPEDVVAYTGTHDTDTAVGWYRSLGDEQRDCLHYYLATDGQEIHWGLLDAVWGSSAGLAIAPIQDVLGLGSDARFNTPGTTSGNWDWRITREGLDEDVARRLWGLTDHHLRTQV